MSVKKLAKTTKRIEDWRANWEPSGVERSIVRWLDKLGETENSNTPRMCCGALSTLAGNYRIMAEYWQLHRGDTRLCKENMYRAAWCQWAVCRWPDQAVNGSMAQFNGVRMVYFWYRAFVALALGEDEAVIRAQVEQALADLESLKSVRKGAPVELRILLDILNGDEGALDEHLKESISYERSNRDRYNLMDWHAIACAKIAMRRGMKV